MAKQRKNDFRPSADFRFRFPDEKEDENLYPQDIKTRNAMYRNALNQYRLPRKK